MAAPRPNGGPAEAGIPPAGQQCFSQRVCVISEVSSGASIGKVGP